MSTQQEGVTGLSPQHGGISVSNYKQSFKDEERAVLLNTMQAVDAFINIRATMPLQYVKSFMLVATDEGRNVSWYAKKAGVSPALMTRHLADLGHVNRYHETGFGLVEQFDDDYDKRFRLVRLTPKGRGVANQIIRAHLKR